MVADPMSPEVLVSVPNELEAAAIVDALAEHGIRARAVGGYTSGFRAEAPGDVKVVVGRADRARAEEMLAEIRSEPAEVDWSQVDVGDGPTSEGEPPDDASSEDRLPWYQFNLATLLAVQTIASVGLAAWKSLHGWVDFAVVFFLTYVAFLAITPFLIAAGTIGIATDMDRARQIGRYMGRALTVGLALAAGALRVREARGGAGGEVLRRGGGVFAGPAPLTSAASSFGGSFMGSAGPRPATLTHRHCAVLRGIIRSP